MKTAVSALKKMIQIPPNILTHLKSTRVLKGAAIGAATSFTLLLSAVAFWKLSSGKCVVTNFWLAILILLKLKI